MKRSGVTMMELIISMCVIGIFLTIAFPRGSDDSAILKNTSEHLVTDLRECAYNAQHRRISNYYMKINSSESSYVIYAELHPVKRVNIPDGVYIFTNLESSTMGFRIVRGENIGKAFTIWLYSPKIKRVERITVAVASTRIKSYSESYEQNKVDIDARMKVFQK